MATGMQSPNMNQAAQAVAVAQAPDIQTKNNRHFMALSQNYVQDCRTITGASNVQVWSAGQPLTFIFPTGNNAYLVGYWIELVGSVTLAAGSSAVYALTAGAPLTLIDSIQLRVGGARVHDYRPVFLRQMNILRGGRPNPVPRVVLSGYGDSYYDNFIYTALGASTGTNTFALRFYVPCNLIHPQDVRGIIPCQNGRAPVDIVINCAGALLGPDPVLNTFYANGGSGQAVSSTAINVSVMGDFKAGQCYNNRAPLSPDLSGLESVQMIRDKELNNLTALNMLSYKPTYLAMYPQMIMAIIDGNQSNKYAVTSNVQMIRTQKDENGKEVFWQYGLNTNLDVRYFYHQLLGRPNPVVDYDIEEGIFPLVWGPTYEQAYAPLQEGAAYLNMTDAQDGTGGHTDWRAGFQLATIGSMGTTGINPRVLMHEIALDSGYQ